jgi:hypothetical protein
MLAHASSGFQRCTINQNWNSENDMEFQTLHSGDQSIQRMSELILAVLKMCEF